MRLYVAPYKLGSESGKLLARSLGALRTEGNKSYRHPSTFINWGNSSLSVSGRGVRRVLNRPAGVAIASNKLKAFNVLSTYGVPILEYTTDITKAKAWVESDGVVYGRSILNGSQGVGIKIITGDDYSFPMCPLYTRAVIGKGVQEFRVHVAGGKVIDFTRKRRRSGEDVQADNYVRNYDNGWVFCRQDEALPDMVQVASLMAVKALGLDFGACDILFKDNKVYILEVNTAPGIEGSTLEKYINFFQEKCRAY
jgi:glutathione synthase/RimK-type ligase-like ATP-grasp enzyme